MIHFSEKDIQQIKERGSSPEEVAQWFQFFEKGFPYADLQAAATIGNGILQIPPAERDALLQQYDTLIQGKKLVKFVPASGAASRMFKELFSYMENEDETTSAKARTFLSTLPSYAFYHDLEMCMSQDGVSLESAITDGDYRTVLTYLLTEKGLNYGNKPKAALKFHRYPDECRTAMEEHFVEAARYARSSDGKCRLHFTVSPQHLPLFNELLGKVQPVFEKRFNVSFEVGFSTQSPSTDTLAATEDNEPFRDKNGQLLFRPGGHGALIQNVNALDADIIFVKNIDNVFCEDALEDTIVHKKLLAASLITLQNKLFDSLKDLRSPNISLEKQTEILQFAKEKLGVHFDNEHPSREEIFSALNRPLRVCGMVKNEGEPGGGPFWVRNSQGKTSLQIVESSQINQQNPQQKEIMMKSTHFNPVDMVCGTRTFEGDKFDLIQYVDSETGFISSKSYEGRPLKAMELPGLWNGAMAHWITLFVEVPLTTFHPIKTVFDLKK